MNKMNKYINSIYYNTEDVLIIQIDLIIALEISEVVFYCENGIKNVSQIRHHEA